jgi:hypothetical protein
MFLTCPLIDRAITRFDRWSVSPMGVFQQLTMHAPVQPSLSSVGVRAEAAKRVAEVSAQARLLI